MTNKNQIASACIGECMQHQHKLRDANRQWFRIFRPRTRIQMKISTHFNQTHTHTQIVETNALNARIRDTEIEKRTDEERCGGDWMGRAQLESVRQFRFRLLNTDRDGTIIQVVVVHKIESTANFSFFFPPSNNLCIRWCRTVCPIIQLKLAFFRWLFTRIDWLFREREYRHQPKSMRHSKPEKK